MAEKITNWVKPAGPKKKKKKCHGDQKLNQSAFKILFSKEL